MDGARVGEGDLKGVTGRGHCKCKGSGTRAAWSTGGSSREDRTAGTGGARHKRKHEPESLSQWEASKGF